MVTDDLYTKTIEGEVEVGAQSTKRIVNSDQFYSKHYTPEGKEFFIFVRQGDYVKGILLPGGRDNSHINRTKSWRIKVWEARQNGKKRDQYNEIEEFFANRQVQNYIKRYELERKCVRIVFIGRKKSGFGGRSAKVYRVYVDQGVFESKESECYEPKRRKCKKPAKR